ncbi:MAG: HAD hydrolase family protein [Candidatus Celaenobacter antarcticus]|nr:HAD hydrolase family protein [Candidatus Celaenobacter antarcticus]
MRYKLFIFDVDGVFTDGGLYYLGTGSIGRKFNVRDGLGIRLLQQTALVSVVVSGKKTEIVMKRMKVLNIPHVYLGIRNKLSTVENIMRELDATFEEVIFMGDDWNDMPVLEKVGCAITVPEASREIKDVCAYVTENHGGSGAVREAIEWILKKENLFDQAVKSFLAYLQNNE